MTKHFIATAIALALVVPVARADYIATVTLDTDALAGDPSQGPFAVDFSLTAGNTVSGNNTATISDFTLNNSGMLTSGTINTSGGVTGNLDTSPPLILSDSSNFYNDFNQQFTPGNAPNGQLSFKVDLTLAPPPSGSTPDQFTFTVFSNLNDPNGPSVASQLIIDIGNPPGVTPLAGSLGDGTSVPAPVVTPQTAVPEPSTLVLSLIGVFGLAGGSWRRRNRTR